MGELKFLVKCMLLTVVLLFAMQIHWGEDTVEGKFDTWIRTSKITQFLKKSSEGGGIFLQRSFHSIEKSVRGIASVSEPTKTEKSDPEDRPAPIETHHPRD